MNERTFDKIMRGFMIACIGVALICGTVLLGYHLLAGNLNLFTFVAFSAIWYIAYYLLRLTIAEE